jgi:hypothetical protein
VKNNRLVVSKQWDFKEKTMENKRFLLGILVMALVFGMTVIGCDNSEGNGGGNVDTRYRGTYQSITYSGTTTITTYEYKYIVSATKVEYTSSTNGTVTTNTIYDEAWTEGQELWVRGNNTRSLIGTFDADGSTLTASSRVYTKAGRENYSLDGTWSYSIYRYYFSGDNYSGNYERYYNNNPYEMGDYYTSNDSMTMTITHLGRSRLSSTYLGSSSQDWYSRDEARTAYLGYYREQLQRTWDSYGSSAASAFQRTYGTTDLGAIAETNYGNQVDNSLNSTYKDTTSTVAYALSSTLFLGGITYTRE